MSEYESSYPRESDFTEDDSDRRVKDFLEAAAGSGTETAKQLQSLLREHKVILFEAGVPGYETSPIFPLPQGQRKEVIQQVIELDSSPIRDGEGE